MRFGQGSIRSIGDLGGNEPSSRPPDRGSLHPPVERAHGKMERCTCTAHTNALTHGAVFQYRHTRAADRTDEVGLANATNVSSRTDEVTPPCARGAPRFAGPEPTVAESRAQVGGVTSTGMHSSALPSMRTSTHVVPAVTPTNTNSLRFGRRYTRKTAGFSLTSSTRSWSS